MSLLVDVVAEITIPIVLMIGLGTVLQRRLAFDVTTLNRLVVYGTLPSLLVVTLSSVDLPVFEVQATALFTVAQFFALLAFGWAVAALLGLDRSLRPVIGMAAAFSNTGNYGIPVIELAFGAAYVPHQAVITSVLSVLILGLAPLLLATGLGLRDSLLGLVRTPVVPAVAVGLALNGLGIALPFVVRYPLELVAGANTPAALIALGAQLGAGSWALGGRTVALGVGLRLAAGPAVTALMLLVLGLPDGLSDLFLVGAGLPVGILLPIFCAEYGGHARLASAIVAISTALSPLAVTVLVTLARLT